MRRLKFNVHAVCFIKRFKRHNAFGNLDNNFIANTDGEFSEFVVS